METSPYRWCTWYSEISQLIFDPKKMVYTNPYRLRPFQFISVLNSFYLYEHVFICLLQHKTTNDIIPYYISKEYDPSSALRFVFIFPGNMPYPNLFIIESPAKVFERPSDYNIELHYLEKRRQHKPGKLSLPLWYNALPSNGLLREKYCSFLKIDESLQFENFPSRILVSFIQGSQIENLTSTNPLEILLCDRVFGQGGASLDLNNNEAIT